MNPWYLAFISVFISSAAQFVMKAGIQRHADADVWSHLMRPLVIAGLALYALSAVIWLSVLARMEVSKAYPIVGFGFVLIAMLGWWLDEQFTWERWLGIALIAAGVALVGRS